jgi:hypothetical protein
MSWSYLMDIMTFLGFGLRWRNWIAALWATLSSAFLLNGELGIRIWHRGGEGGMVRRPSIPYAPLPRHGTPSHALPQSSE